VSVFIGWSGPRSKAVAIALAEWLPQVIQAATPWVSEDMDRGAQWFATIGSHLKTADYGLLCVTAENAAEPWVLFEAGALALRTGEGLACPYLLDMAPAALQGPLAQLQAATANRDGTEQVVETINRLLDDGVRLPPDRLSRVFDRWWPDLDAKLEAARHVAPVAAVVPARSADDKLNELLDIARALQRAEGRVITTTAENLGLGPILIPRSAGPVRQGLLQYLIEKGALNDQLPIPAEPEATQTKLSRRLVRPKIRRAKKLTPRDDGS